jgi:hypothetical protein
MFGQTKCIAANSRDQGLQSEGSDGRALQSTEHRAPSTQAPGDTPNGLGLRT